MFIEFGVSFRDYQEINYPILWGGRLARPRLGADKMSTPQEKLYVFLFGSPLLDLLQKSLIPHPLPLVRGGERLLSSNAGWGSLFLIYATGLLNSGSRLLNSGSRLLNSGNRLLNSGNRLLNSGNRLLNSGNRLLNSGNRLLNSGNRLLFLFNFNLSRIKPKHKKTFHPVPSDALSLPLAQPLVEKCPQLY
ncbi:hypothetical protein [Nostoc sp.]|uniref:hypothetical protein n=1 Tax=Nostoc sp. TaxID=1180 RepID=UPI002FFBFA73